MKRRQFLSCLAASAAMSIGANRPWASGGNEGRCLIVLQARGGWDIASFCDPKKNLPGEREITQWSRNADIRQAGNIRYAPYARNQAFFEKYYRYTMVINGIDAQTNAHSVGEVHNWSGRNSAGFPTLAAAHSAIRGPDLPLSYLSFGGVSETARLLRASRLDNPDTLPFVLRPNRGFGSGNLQRGDTLAMIESAQQEKLKRIIASPASMPLERYNADSHLFALQRKAGLEEFEALLPDPSQFPPPRSLSGLAGAGSLETQIMLTILAFKAGVTASADLYQRGFDTHQFHDRDHEPTLAYVTDSLDFLWNYAEQQGIADRLTVVVGSEFGRTPWYNSGDGKDHWPIGSMLIMQKNAPWGNRVAGLTDEGQNAFKLNPVTLKRDDGNGTNIYPKHIHKALRKYLGINNNALLADFQFPGVEDFDFFNPNKSTS